MKPKAKKARPRLMWDLVEPGKDVASVLRRLRAWAGSEAREASSKMAGANPIWWDGYGGALQQLFYWLADERRRLANTKRRGKP